MPKKAAKKKKPKGTRPIQVRYKHSAGVRHTGRARRSTPYDFTGRVWVTIAPDDAWQCDKCNQKFSKQNFASAPKVCNTSFTQMFTVTEDTRAWYPVKRSWTCDGRKFRDDIDIAYFMGKAESNPGDWEVK